MAQHAFNISSGYLKVPLILDWLIVFPSQLNTLQGIQTLSSRQKCSVNVRERREKTWQVHLTHTKSETMVGSLMDPECHVSQISLRTVAQKWINSKNFPLEAVTRRPVVKLKPCGTRSSSSLAARCNICRFCHSPELHSSSLFISLRNFPALRRHLRMSFMTTQCRYIKFK